MLDARRRAAPRARPCRVQCRRPADACCRAAGAGGRRRARRRPPSRPRLDGHRRHRSRRPAVDGPPAALRRRVRPGRPGVVAVRAGAQEPHPRGDRPLRARLSEPAQPLGSLSDAGRAARDHEAGRDRRSALRGRAPAHRGIALDRRARAGRRSPPALRAGLGRARGPGAGAARRARHPAEAARALHRRAQQEVEPGRLPVHRHAPSGALDDRGQRHLQRLVRRRRSGGRSGQRQLREGARRRTRRARRLLRRAARRRHQDGRHADRLQAVARRARGSVAAQLGRALRARLGAAVRHVRAAHHGRRSHRALRDPRAGPAARRRRAGQPRGPAGRREPVARRPRRRRPPDAVSLLAEGSEDLHLHDPRQRAVARGTDRRDHGRRSGARRGRSGPPPACRAGGPTIPAPAAAEGVHHGAGTVSQWRREFLADFAARLERARTPAATR